MSRSFGAVLIIAGICLGTASAKGQQGAASADIRESLDEAWWTGPMLAPNATTLPHRHFLLEPYLYDVITHGFYNSNGIRIRAPHANSFGSLTYMNYGLADRITVGVIPTFGYRHQAHQFVLGFGASVPWLALRIG